MELRYMGFEQAQNKRVYKFAADAYGHTPGFQVSVDVALFLKHRINMQEGPSLCAQKLKADLQADVQGAHELTEQDLCVYVAHQAAAQARKAESRSRNGRHRRTANPSQPVSPWWR